jgi:hypothetical protein
MACQHGKEFACYSGRNYVILPNYNISRVCGDVGMGGSGVGVTVAVKGVEAKTIAAVHLAAYLSAWFRF